MLDPISAAASVYGLVTGTIEIIKTAIDIYEAVEVKSGLPRRLRMVAEKLPSVEDLLRSAEEQYRKGKPDEKTWIGAKLNFERCNKHCEALRDIFDEAFPNADANKLQRIWKGTLAVAGSKGSKAEALMRDIYEDLHILEQRQIIESTELLAGIKATLDELASEDGSRYHHSGSGAQNVNEGTHNTVYSMSGPGGRQFNAPITHYHEGSSIGTT